MAWIEVHQSLPTHAKTVEAAALLDVPEVEVVGHMVCLWLWAVDNAREGRVNVAKPLVIAKAARWAGEPGRFVDALLAAGFMDEDGCIHDWDEYTGRLVEQRRQHAERNKARAVRNRRRLRAAVIARDGLICGICGGPVDPTDIHLDHVIHASRGGPTTIDNLRVTHRMCNLRRGNRP